MPSQNIRNVSAAAAGRSGNVSVVGSDMTTKSNMSADVWSLGSSVR